MWKPTPPPFSKFKTEKLQSYLPVMNFIYQLGESPILRQSSKEVALKDISKTDFQAKIIYLKHCMRRFRKITGIGRGITAVQVGIPERFAVIYVPEIKSKQMIIINPKIIKKSANYLIYPEVCMSANPIIARVKRPAWIEFEYYDETGRLQYWAKKSADALGMMYNRVFQHEIDHMDGVINIDLVQSKDLVLESDPSYYDNARFEEVV